MRTCERVRVYGFGPSCEGKYGRRYYKHEGDKRVFLGHGYDQELRVIRKMALGGKWLNLPPHIQSSIHAKKFTMVVPPCWRGKNFSRTRALKAQQGHVSDVSPEKVLRAQVSYV